MSILNSLKGLFNSQEAASVSSPTDPIQPVNAVAMNPEGYRAQYVTPPLDDFETTYGPYIGFKRRGVRNQAEYRPLISPKMAKAILGPLGDFKNAVELATEYENQEKIHATLDGLNFFAATKIFQQEQAERLPKFLAGEQVEFRTKDQITGDLHLKRNACREGLRQSSARVFELLKPNVTRAEAMLRQLVIDRDKLERDEHAKYFDDYSTFRPSEYLKTLVYVALIVVPRPIANFHLNGNLSAPDPSAGLLALWFPPASAPALPPARPTAKDHPLEVERRERQAQEDAKSHAEKLADKNLQVEKARKAAAELQGQIAESQARKAVAIEAFKAQLSSGTPPVQP